MKCLYSLSNFHWGIQTWSRRRPPIGWLHDSRVWQMKQRAWMKTTPPPSSQTPQQKKTQKFSVLPNSILFFNCSNTAIPWRKTSQLKQTEQVKLWGNGPATHYRKTTWWIKTMNFDLKGFLLFWGGVLLLMNSFNISFVIWSFNRYVCGATKNWLWSPGPASSSMSNLLWNTVSIIRSNCFLV